MKTKTNGLDEMQRGKRNSIGNQMFMILFYALLIDCSLYGAGIRWLAPPSNTMVIIVACMAVYLVRVIAANAYLPPQAHGRKTLKFLVLSVIFAIGLGVTAARLFQDAPAEAGSNDNTALILFIVSAVGLVISLIVALVKKADDKNSGDD